MRLMSVTSPHEVWRSWAKHERRFQVLALIAGMGAVAIVSIFLMLIGDLADPVHWRRLGYAGVFLLSFLGSVSLVLPVPGLIAVCGAGSLQLFLIGVGLLSGTGETMGEISGYAIGYGGRGVIEKRKFYHRVEEWMQHRGGFVIFLVSIIPNPAFDVVGIAAGSVRFPLLRFLAIVWVGKILKGIIVAHTCFWIARMLPWVG